MTAQDLVDHGTQYARSGCKESIKGMKNRHFRVGAKQIVIVDTGKAVANVIDDGFDCFGEEWVARSGRDKSIPKTHSFFNGSSRLCTSEDRSAFGNRKESVLVDPTDGFCRER